MKAMLKFLISTLLITGYSLAQINDVQTKFIAPKFIPQNSSFQLIALLRKINSDVDSLELRLNISEETKLDSVALINNDTLVFLKAEKEQSGDFNKIGYSVFLDFKDSLLNKADFTEVVYYLKSDSKEEINFNFDFRLKLLTDSVALASQFFNSSEESKIKSYKISETKGLAKLIGPGKNFTIEGNTDKGNLIFSYWIKFKQLKESGFYLLHGEENDSLCAFSVRENGLIDYCKNSELMVFDDFSFSQNAWYKFVCFVEPANGAIMVFINDELLAEKKISASFIDRHIIFEIKNPSSQIVIDDVKILKYSGCYERFLNEKHELGNFPDSLGVVLAENFDSRKINKGQKGFEIKCNDEGFLPSDAPAFATMPELNLSAFSTYYYLEWKSAENTKPVEFVLEKSVDGEDYVAINKQTVSEEEEKEVFSFTDAKSFTDEVVYYRVLQKNSDSSEIYSNQVKIGQGQIEEFAVEQNYPNPFSKGANGNPVTNIKVEVFVPGEYKITVFDLVGKEISNIYSGYLSRGNHSFTFDGSGLPSGIYFYEITSPSSSKVMKMILAK